MFTFNSLFSSNFGEDFLRDFFKNKDISYTYKKSVIHSDNSNVESQEEQIKKLQKKYGGEIKNTEEVLKKITTTWVSADGSMTREFIRIISPEKEKSLEELNSELQKAIETQDFELCSILRDKINALKSNENQTNP